MMECLTDEIYEKGLSVINEVGILHKHKIMQWIRILQTSKRNVNWCEKSGSSSSGIKLQCSTSFEQTRAREIGF